MAWISVKFPVFARSWFALVQAVKTTKNYSPRINIPKTQPAGFSIILVEGEHNRMRSFGDDTAHMKFLLCVQYHPHGEPRCLDRIIRAISVGVMAAFPRSCSMKTTKIKDANTAHSTQHDKCGAKKLQKTMAMTYSLQLLLNRNKEFL